MEINVEMLTPATVNADIDLLYNYCKSILISYDAEPSKKNIMDMYVSDPHLLLNKIGVPIMYIADQEYVIDIVKHELENFINACTMNKRYTVV